MVNIIILALLIVLVVNQLYLNYKRDAREIREHELQIKALETHISASEAIRDNYIFEDVTEDVEE
ncbi:hypothetical protein [Enterococcus sp. DIV1420a]|uniref:hypothetical protein n=1 Tax=Enterococcus sp. DIV1420a TaxID=2774672 RepID=UPI003F27690E